jgi:hypothetical protein
MTPDEAYEILAPPTTRRPLRHAHDAEMRFAALKSLVMQATLSPAAREDAEAKRVCDEAEVKLSVLVMLWEKAR